MPKIVDRELYRKELLNKSFELFAEKGYSSVTMREIASGIGVSTGTLYHYFPSKESLFEQLIEYLSYEDTKEEELAELGNPPTLGERIQEMMNYLAKNEDYIMKSLLIIFDFCQNKTRREIDNNQALQQAGKRYEEAVCCYLGVSDPSIAIFIINSIDGLLVRRFYQGERISFAEQANLLKEMLLAYLEKKQPQI
ncbi:MAG: TetR/AcrR family transcriptional regulator [Microcoleus sp. PH2017_10_PVI_O_A]|uniref:TetR/AcrR family transcriptional regulator n=1 Tax=unclassified Microcoleus TaxID=2642155 RepID=UPI001D7DB1F0|nr:MULTISPECIES: TetR/AcrR family transcriptional regulator [unclassified Microcoleus]TAE85738.1 MAG: TetR/AcrR family transcriptional regulator [Oscillatoriales cyanobacterium]MCC3404258.1 TetR/AcrR family transcriptional regulator [Microcoleus sp. PH2017_10_PVI_O_A]MCC3458344.1 TetR/AcrR family transcriptional regulator [Microcoleus sp. PH2017_11_PCY_U_A]MCC3478415.1 TetR/AcrR family transcriptional regulator [Microcoleus sp. PH2017_12_PCY_D_A]MCC3529032.1 TetR/AcrR family transcriptional re